jgi:predicted membrane-bound spermidine synthase
MISLQILILLAFQVLYGALYFQLAVLIGIFMAGMSAGTFAAVRVKKKNGERMLVGINMLICLPAVFTALLIFIDFSATVWFGRFVFYLLSGITGACGGFVFPAVCRIYYKEAASFNPGSVYALDLTGAMAGALLTAAFIIPLFGFQGILIIILAAHLLIAAGIWMRDYSER